MRLLPASNRMTYPLEKVVTTDGRPCQEMEISVRDASGSEMGPEQEGDLVARGAHPSTAMFRAPDSPRSALPLTVG